MVLRSELSQLKDDFDLELLGFDDDELRILLTQAEQDTDGESQDESIPKAPAEPVTRLGDLWRIGKRHRLICGDSRNRDVLARLFDGARANLVFTSPPYATQREYDPTSGFQPVRPEEYVKWFRDVAKNIAAVLAPDGSYFLNIKEHCEDGQRHLYVKDLTLAHVRHWGWRFAHLTGVEPVLAETGGTMSQVAAERGVPCEQGENVGQRRSTIAGTRGGK
ncbi:MAG: site-specific DNA-methyltransferase [Acidobacteriia bacterium]|nr:site-specific DNA-methyltransferase [Terriglobia bacterium]